jgi:hypothetical protein
MNMMSHPDFWIPDTKTVELISAHRRRLFDAEKFSYHYLLRVAYKLDIM